MLTQGQKIQYAKSKSNFVAKLDGTFKMPNSGSGAANVEQTELQQSIFNAPPPGSAPPAAAKSAPAVDQAMRDATPESRGQKRTRDEEDEEEDSGEDVAMEEDSDDE